MNIFKLLVSALLLVTSFSLSGCQGNNGDAPTNSGTNTDSGTIPTNPVLPGGGTVQSVVITPVLQKPYSSTITQNNQVVEVEVTVIDAANRPYSEGNIELIYPNDVRTGRDVGSFDKITSPIKNGKAVFSYTAPSDISSDKSDIVFGFFHDSNASVNVNYTFKIVPDTTQFIHSSYELTMSNPTDVVMGRNATKDIAFTVKSKAGLVVPSSDMTSISATVKEIEKATMVDSSITTPTATITRSQLNPLSLTVNSNDISGIVPIEVTAIFKGSDNSTVTLTKIFNVIVLSGPPSSVSVEYVGSSFSNGKYKETWVLKAIDEDGNKVNTSPSISSGLLVGYAKSNQTNNPADYLFYGRTPGGTLSSVASKGKFTSATTNIFAKVDTVNDKLVTLGTGYSFNALGKWEIENVNASSLDLKDGFTTADVTGLAFAVGHNLRDETCADLVTATAEVNVVNPILDSSGKAVLEIEYGDYLVGKTLVLWTNFLGSNNNSTQKIGYARKITLVGTGLTTTVAEIPKGFSGSVTLPVFVQDSPHGRPYLNANFGYAIKSTVPDVTVSVASTSMVAGIKDCTNDGAAYVTVNVTGTASSAGQIELIDLRIGDEF